MPNNEKVMAVFVHGAGGSASQWHPLVGHLQSWLEPVFYELPGHGDRSNCVGGCWRATCEDFADFVTKHNLYDFCLIAHSVGGLLALQYVLNSPKLVKHLVLVSTAAKIMLHPDFIRQVTTYSMDEEFLLSGFAPGTPHEHMQLVIDDYSRLKLSKPLNDFMGVSQIDLSRLLPNVSVKTSVLMGEKDKIISPRRSRELVKKIPAATSTIISNAAHYPHLENTEETAKTIKQELREVCFATNSL